MTDCVGSATCPGSGGKGPARSPPLSPPPRRSPPRSAPVRTMGDWRGEAPIRSRSSRGLGLLSSGETVRMIKFKREKRKEIYLLPLDLPQTMTKSSPCKSFENSCEKQTIRKLAFHLICLVFAYLWVLSLFLSFLSFLFAFSFFFVHTTLDRIGGLCMGDPTDVFDCLKCHRNLISLRSIAGNTMLKSLKRVGTKALKYQVSVLSHSKCKMEIVYWLCFCL